MQSKEHESISIELTNKCNLKCSFCYADAQYGGSVEKIPLENWQRFFSRFKNQGGRRILLTGGEIMLCDQLVDIIRLAKKENLLVDLFTNGTILDIQTAKYISQNSNLITVSLDGPDWHHDAIRGIRGSYMTTLKNVTILKKENANLSFQCMITPQNICEINWLYMLIERFDPLMIKLGHVSKMGRGIGHDELYVKSLKELKLLANRLAKELNHYHTRIITNVISREELNLFYYNMQVGMTPWLVASGDILTCYVNRNRDYWRLSHRDIYPRIDGIQNARREYLAYRCYEMAKKLDYFDMMELVDSVAEMIVEEDKSKIVPY